MKAGKSTAELISSDLTEAIVDQALKAGADSADCIAFETTSLTASQRLGKREDLQRSETNAVGLRVFVGRRQAITSSSDRKMSAVKALVDRAVAMARAAPDDPYAGLADKKVLANTWQSLNIFDEYEPTPKKLFEVAGIVEEAAMNVTGVTNSEGAEAGWSSSSMTLSTSNGFNGAYKGTHFSTSVSVLAGADSGMERDYDYAIARLGSDLESPEEIGRRAGTRAVQRLNPRKIDSGQMPVIFDNRIASSLLGHFVSSVNGQSVARKTSFLRDNMNHHIFKPEVTIVDDPLRPSGIASRPFDAEGVTCRAVDLVKAGQLKSWILDSTTARQLELETTGHASRGTSSPPIPSASNLYLRSGTKTRNDLIGNIKEGILVTELIGMGINMITGDYSRGAAGFRIENGEITYPISEITVAGNLRSMFAELTPADDLVYRYGMDSPTVRVEGMTVAGN